MPTASQAEVGPAGILQLGNVCLDLNTFEVLLNDDIVAVTYLEFELLRLLATAHDKVMTLDDLTSSLWRQTGRLFVRRLNVMICRLRIKLDRSAPYHLITVRGRGYGLIARPNYTGRRRATAQA